MTETPGPPARSGQASLDKLCVSRALKRPQEKKVSGRMSIPARQEGSVLI